MDEDMDIEAMLDAPLKESRKNKEVSPPAVKESKESKEKVSVSWGWPLWGSQQLGFPARLAPVWDKFELKLE